MKLQTKGAVVNYEVAGQGDTLALIHGSGDNLEAWWGQTPVFSKQYQVLTFDARGHGKTEVTSGDYSNDAIIEDLSSLLQHLNVPRAAVLGYSMGGGLASGFAIKHPEVTRALIISNSAGGLGPSPTAEQLREREERRTRQTEALERGDLEPLFTDRLTSMFSPGFPARKPDVIARYKTVFMANDPVEFQKRSQTGGGGGALNYSAITCPTLIIVGEHDQGSGPVAGKALQQIIKGSDLKVFPTGHPSAMEVPEDYNQAVLEFLARVAVKA